MSQEPQSTSGWAVNLKRFWFEVSLKPSSSFLNPTENLSLGQRVKWPTWSMISMYNHQKWIRQENMSTGENTRCDADEYSVSKHCGSFFFFFFKNLNMYDWWKNAKNLFSILQYSDTVSCTIHSEKKQVVGFIFSRILVYIDKYIDVSCLEDINK